ncbi:MAG: protoheme IX farnesyltransferase, partial [Alphaproteobacteria bacterium]
WDADIDRHMRRTRGRPVPAGRIAPEAARDLGLGLSAISIAMLGLIANWAAAALLAFTIFFYVVIYTIWLKRRTPQNIVIGGAAGAFPPMIGWLAATGSLDWPALLMFALIFMWTPPHFWALALFVRDDYSNAGVPMLTVTHGRDHARRAILIYTVLLVPVSLALAFSSVGGPVTAAAAVLLDLAFLRGAWRIARRDDAQSAADHHAAERAFFKLSLLYLFLHFAALLADSALAGLGLAPAGWPRIL